ncbi:MAG: HAMP domain-containing sensor histidine kinase [Clostridia bacterium]|nr:HAMP domain-containing sensor histidine kinase [Clostridia bacterium]
MKKRRNKSSKKGIDIYSFGFSLWFYLSVVSVIAVLAYLFLGLLSNLLFYQELKENEVKGVANDIIDICSDSDFLFQLATKEFEEDVEFAVLRKGSTYVYYKSTGFDDRYIVTYLEEYGGQDNVVTTLKIDNDRYSFCVLDALVNEGEVVQAKVFVYSKAVIRTTTTNILIRTFVYIAVVVVIISLLIALIISKKLSKPLKMVGEMAKQLATGNYELDVGEAQYSEVEDLANTLSLTAKQLSQTEDLKNELIANVSHDLKTPLTLIKSYAEMIRDLSGEDPEKRNEHLQVIISEAERLNVLVNDLVDYSRIEASKYELNLTELDIGKLVKQVAARFTVDINYRFEIVVTNGLNVLADYGKITQVVYNLIANAVNYTANEMYVGVFVFPDNAGRVKVEVKDSGMGIASEELALIWNRYYRTKNNHTRGKAGSGLGLSIVKSILEKHNAEFGVESEVGKGSNFYFFLPLSSLEKNLKEQH